MVDYIADCFEETSALNNSSFDSEVNLLWEDYWLEKGEEIIWASWIEKYQNYINLEYVANWSTTLDVEGAQSNDNNQLPELLSTLAIMDHSARTTTEHEDDSKIHQSNIQHSGKDTPSLSQPSTDGKGEEPLCDADPASQQWQLLWNEHYEEQYSKSYSEFISKKQKLDNGDFEKTNSGMKDSAEADEESTYSMFNEHNAEMNDLGLPTSFGRRKNVKEKCQNTFCNDWSTSTGNSDRFNDPNQPVETRAKRKRTKKKRRQYELSAQLPEEIAGDKMLMKYWSKRFSLFSRFDLGIKLDKESWFSVTPEKIAAYTASRCKCDIIVDAFCGAGGNTIQFAKTCSKVIAIDIDPLKIDMAKHNASVYGVENKIEFIVGSFIDLADSLVADAVFLSPPWGGPEYLKNDVYDIEEFLLPVPASELMAISRRISPNICIYLPRNSNKTQLCVLAGRGNSVEVNQEFLGQKLIAISAYYGDLFKAKASGEEVESQIEE